jgi:hypothetical protein
MSMSGYPRLKTVLNAPSSCKNAMAHVRGATGALGTVLNPTGFEARAAFTSLRMHLHWILTKTPFFSVTIFYFF